MLVHQRFLPGLAIYSYIVGDEKSGECAVIDPTRDVDYYLQWAKSQGLRLRHVLETHVHADFVSGSNELKARLKDEVKIHCSGEGGPDWTPPYADEIVRNGHTVRMGQVRLEAMHTPGHTPEHLSWSLYDESRSVDTPWLLFTGDFVFVGDVGRPDLLGEAARKELAHKLYESIFQKLPGLPDFTEVMPGHGAGSLCGKSLGRRGNSTLGYERRSNAALQPKAEEEWTTNLLEDMPIAPPYFRRMKQVNARGPEIIGGAMPGQSMLTAKEVYERTCAECLVVDTRSKEAFAGAHIPRSINIPSGDTFSTWAGWVLPYDVPFILVLDEAGDSTEVATQLLRVGFDDIRGYIEGGIGAWESSGYPLEHLRTMSVHELDKALHGAAAPFVLDVRSESEWKQGHIRGAHHIHGGMLQERIDEIPKDKEVAVICGSGYRASIAASFLKRSGTSNVSNVIGGMSAYKAAGFEVV